MYSLRQQLAKIGENSASFNYRKFRVAPTSLRQSMKAMESPRPERWRKKNEGKFENKDWTEENQGVTTDYKTWYLSSNKKGRQRVYRFGLDNKVKSHVKLAGSKSNHLGDIDYYKGYIYCALENKHQVATIKTSSFKNYTIHPVKGSDGVSKAPNGSLPWCAINPWNEFLYTSDFGDADGAGVNRMFSFQKVGNTFRYRPDADIILKNRVKRIQGACFTKNGHLLIASDHSNDIKCYSVLNGKYLGRVKVQVSHGWPKLEEIEGICVWENVTYKGHKTHIHLILLDNDISNRDDIFFKHFQVPDDEYL